MLPWLLHIYVDGYLKEMRPKAKNESGGRSFLGLFYPILTCYMYFFEFSSTVHIHDCSVMIHINASDTCNMVERIMMFLYDN